MRVGHVIELAIMGFVIFVVVNVGAEMLHKPLIADKAGPPHGMTQSVSHTK